MDLHAPRLVRKVRLQWLGLPKEAHLRSHEGTRILRRNGQEIQERIPVSTYIPNFVQSFSKMKGILSSSSPLNLQIRQILGSPQLARRHEGTPRRILGCQQPCWPTKGMRRILPMPLLHQRISQEELRWQQPVNRYSTWFLTLWRSSLVTYFLTKTKETTNTYIPTFITFQDAKTTTTTILFSVST